MEDSKSNLILTEDGTYSIYSSEFKEAMHSTSGAYQEALLKHVYPSKILDQTKNQLYILDVGFGLGYNILALIAESAKMNINKSLHFISFETDKSYSSLIESIKFNDERDKFYSIIKSAFNNNEYDNQNIHITIKFGDAREHIKQLNHIQFDAVFHDPFSPSKNPELWSVNIFKEIYRLMNFDGILTTYSSAPQIRRAMIEAGFIIGKGPSVGKKREGTLAAKSLIIEPLSDDIMELLKTDSRSHPYYDENLNDSRENILNRRISEIKACRRVHPI